MSQKRGTGRRRASRAPQQATRTSTPRPRRRGWRPLGIALSIAAAVIAFLVVGGLVWVARPHRGTGRAVALAWPADGDLGVAVAELEAAGVVDRPWLFRLLLALSSPLVRPVPGPHLLTDDLTPAEVLRRLARLTSRATARVVVPEGYNRFQIAARLEELHVCSRDGFGVATTDRGLLDRLAVAGPSAEGFLFPATYELFADTAPADVVAILVAETKKRLSALRAKRSADFAALEAKYGWTEREVLTLASVIEKESARADEISVIASVFFNRLDDPGFRPEHSLQSDPTAGYGCLVEPDLESCRGYTGRVTPAIVRDPLNDYNTYRHPGLPPGPIANPGLRAVEAVLSPAATPYLFFVRSGDGKHVFTRTFDEHEAAMGHGK